MKAWNTSSWTVERELIADPDQRLDGIRFSPDGKLLITTHANGHVKVWNTSSWTVEGELNVSDSHLLGSAFVLDSKTIIIGGKNGVLHDWSLATKAEIRTLCIFEGVGNISNVAFSPDGKTMVASYESAKSRAVMIWNTTDSSAQIESGYISAAFSKDGKLALGGRGDIKLIDPDSRKDSRKQVRDIELPEMMPGEVEHGDKDAPEREGDSPVWRFGSRVFSGWQYTCCLVLRGNSSLGKGGSLELRLKSQFSAFSSI